MTCIYCSLKCAASDCECVCHKERTTNEIFQHSMTLSEPAYREKGEKLEEYKKWLNKKWRPVEDDKE